MSKADKPPVCLKAAGWKIGTTKDFLGLSDQEAALVEVKLSLIEALKKSRQKRRLSQIDLAQRMGPASHASRKWTLAMLRCHSISLCVP